MVTLNMVNRDNTVEQVNVSEETFAQAAAIYEQSSSLEECINLIEQASTDAKVRSIIADMVLTIHKERAMQQMLIQMLKKVLG